MTAINEKWNELLEPGLRAIFEQQRDALAAESKIPVLFNVLGSDKAEEHDLSIGGFGDWRAFDGTIEYDENEQGYKTTYTHEEFTRGFSVARSLLDDDQYSQIARLPRGLAMSAMRTREKHAASIFNNAFNSAYAGGDSVELCGSHPYSPSNATTHSNAGSTALSATSIEATRQLMRKYVDDRGELVPINPDTLVVPPALEQTAWTAVSTPGLVGSPNNDLNFVAAKTNWNVVVWDYLTDTNNWFMVDSGLAKMYLNWFDRVPLEFQSHPAGEFDLVFKFRGYMRYSYGWSDWRWVYGHAVA